MATLRIRKSVARRLLTLSLALSALPILVTAAVYWTNNSAANQQRASRAARLPVVIKTQQASTATATLAAAGAAIAEIRDLPQVEAMELMTTQALADLQRACADTQATPQRFANVRPMVDEVGRQLTNLSKLAHQRIETGATIQTLSASASKLAEQAATIADRARVAIPVSPESAPARFALVEISSYSRAVAQYIEHLRVAKSPEELREQAAITLRAMIRRLGEVQDLPSRTHLARILLELSGFTGQIQESAAQDVFAARSQDIELQRFVVEARDELRVALTALDTAVDELVQDAHANVLNAADEAIGIIESAQSTGLWIALGLQLAGALIAWRFVRRNVVAKFETLIHAMDRVASGDLSQELAAQEASEDELAQIAHATNVFRARSLELRQRTEELQASESALQEANDDLNQFVYHASHDLKAPMRAISALARILLDDEDMTDAPDYLEIIHARAIRLSTLVDDILAYSRSGRFDQAMEPISIRKSASVAIDLLGLPESVTTTFAGPDELHAPRIAFETTMRNLIDNAYKHHPIPSKLQLAITSRSVSNDVQIDVADNGDGIAPDSAEKVFEVFKTLKSRDEVEGSGMGLSIVKRIVETAGGHIEYVSTESGACFRMTWPKSVAPNTAAPESTATETRGA